MYVVRDAEKIVRGITRKGYMVYGIWYILYGIWCMVYGVW